MYWTDHAGESIYEGGGSAAVIEAFGSAHSTSDEELNCSRRARTETEPYGSRLLWTVLHACALNGPIGHFFWRRQRAIFRICR
jgi:hypothetical protein